MIFLVQKNRGVYEPLRVINVMHIAVIRQTNSGTYIYSLYDGDEFELQLSIRDFVNVLSDSKKVVTIGSYEFCSFRL